MPTPINRWFPQSATADARLLLTTRALRGLADGAVSVLLPGYLTAIGFSPLRVGAIVFGTLLGSAALTLWVGLATDRLGRRRVLLAACALMLLTGIGFATTTSFWPLFVVAVVGTLNPSAGDVSLFLPVEQAALAEAAEPSDLTAMFALYNVAGAMAGAFGALASGVPAILAARHGWALAPALRSGFVAYSILAVIAFSVYRRLSASVEVERQPVKRAPLEKSRAIVIRLSALFSIDALGGGFVIQSLLALWLFRRFNLPVQVAGAFFFAAGLLGSFSQFISAALAARFGRINTMVFSHLPSNAMLILAALVQTPALAMTFLLLRSSMSQMDVPARQSYVMAVVPPEERAAAATVTNVPRSLASALAPLPAGAMLNHSSFGWPLICAGTLKTIYDILLLIQFRAVRPSDEF
ncbi:MAG TPA: MFS transporter [Candidatus Binatus sp.]|uniref:MFS transporter n=1 Tax=Candidatus Binatus sp. TaxID=2811406 RepID=UPI002B48562D|nr:MFS transporter [Candidatus Binatus sp.]HKN14052.1 MFS transporter [Candidatus Binatus sp.]